jgi:hypothetical protein
MSEDLTYRCPPVVGEAGLAVSKYAGPETEDGQTRVRVQLDICGGQFGTNNGTISVGFTVDQWLALGAAVNATTWESPILPICYDSRCNHRPPHGRYPDCPHERDA